MELTLQQLKEIAVKLEFNHSPNIGLETLKSKLEVQAIELGTTLDEVAKSMFTYSTDNASVITSEKAEISTKEKTEQEEIERLSHLSFADVDSDKAHKDEATQTHEAMRLIRAIITCNNKNKTAYQGEIFCARNAVLPEVKKFIPFGVPFHIPKILLNVIKEKQYQQYRKEKRNGNVFNKAFLVPEYNIQELPPITRDELEAIKKKQLAEGLGDD